MIDIEIHSKDLKAKVIEDDKVVKVEDLDKDSFKALMHELCDSDEMLNGLRKATKLFRPSMYMFKDVG